jgi:hypothetical protein
LLDKRFINTVAAKSALINQRQDRRAPFVELTEAVPVKFPRPPGHGAR